MSMPTRRVRRLRLRTASGQPARSAALVEDALRTAALPGYEGARLLVVRSLTVAGVGRDSAAIERHLRDAAARATAATAPTAGRADVVYFDDEVAPYVALARRLCAGAPADEWFWRATVPTWRPGMDRHEAIRLIIRHVASLDGGALATVRLLSALLDDGHADTLLAALAADDATVALLSLGWYSTLADQPTDSGAAMPLSHAHAALLMRWAPTWGGDDPRTRWLAATLLVAERPGRAVDPSLGGTSVRAARAAAAGVRANELETGKGGQGAAERSVSRAGSDSEPGGGSSMVATPAAAIDQTSPTASQIERVVAESPGPMRSTEAAVAEHAYALSIDAEASRSNDRTTPGDVQRLSEDLAATHGAVALTRDAFVPPPRREDPPHADRAANLPDGSAVDGELGALEEIETLDEIVESKPWLALPPATAHAGIFFLVRLLARLGVADLIASRPELIERDWPVRLLRRIARRLGVPAHDPALAALPGVDDGDTVAPEDRALSAEWLWHMRELARRDADLGLRALVGRPGRIAATRTHVDVLFPLRTVDIAVRRAGLDIDPGWVPWLGRVVRFHYLDDEGGA